MHSFGTHLVQRLEIGITNWSVPTCNTGRHITLILFVLMLATLSISRIIALIPTLSASMSLGTMPGQRRKIMASASRLCHMCDLWQVIRTRPQVLKYSIHLYLDLIWILFLVLVTSYSLFLPTTKLSRSIRRNTSGFSIHLYDAYLQSLRPDSWMSSPL